MEMACSMAFRLAMSSRRRDTKRFSSRPSPSSSLAVLTCFSWMAARSIRKAWSWVAAFCTMLSSRSVTFTGALGWLPIALTTTPLAWAGSSAMSCAALVMRSADDRQVPPNLCTCKGQRSVGQA